MDRSKLKLSALLLMVTLPIGLATWTFNARENSGIGGTRSKGELIIPVLDIAEFGLVDADGQRLYVPFDELVANVSPEDYKPRPWQLLYLGGTECDEVCVERLYFLRQLHTRLGREADRVERVYVQASSAPAPLSAELTRLFAEQHPGMKVGFAQADALRNLLAPRAAEGDPVAEHYIYVMDPVGNVMLYFTPANTPEEILSDLDKLLDQSSLG